jgi:hypothetical protein
MPAEVGTLYLTSASLGLFPDRGDERHQDEASADADDEPPPEVVEQNAESDTQKDPAGKAGPP